MKTPAENSTKRLDKSQKEEIQSPFSQGRVRQFAFFWRLFRLENECGPDRVLNRVFAVYSHCRQADFPV